MRSILRAALIGIATGMIVASFAGMIFILVAFGLEAIL